jgi:hypothetical protein
MHFWSSKSTLAVGFEGVEKTQIKSHGAFIKQELTAALAVLQELAVVVAVLIELEYCLLLQH